MSEMTGYIEQLTLMRDRAEEVDDLAALDMAVQAMDLLQAIKSSKRLHVVVERELGEDIWPV